MAGCATTGGVLAEPTPDEQYALELMNRSRLDPESEELHVISGMAGDRDFERVNALVPGGWSMRENWTPADPARRLSSDMTARRPPLAMNRTLLAAAREYSRTLLGHFPDFGHRVGGKASFDRVARAGYPAFSGENVSAWGSSSAGPAIEELHTQIFFDWNTPRTPSAPPRPFLDRGHRTMILRDGHKEVGIGLCRGRKQGLNMAFMTQDFGRKRGQWLVGVVFKDAPEGQNRDFYDPGEGLGGVQLAIPGFRMARGENRSWKAGGLKIDISDLPKGTHEIIASGGALPAGTRIKAEFTKVNDADNVYVALRPDADGPAGATAVGSGFSSETTDDLSRIPGVLGRARKADRDKDAIAAVATAFPESAGAAVPRQ